MREKPILFSGEMVRAILAGKKTQTRRVMKPQPPQDAVMIGYRDMDYIAEHLRGKVAWFEPGGGDLWPCNPKDAVKCPYSQVGDRLWVRESFGILNPVGELEGLPLFEYETYDSGDVSCFPKLEAGYTTVHKATGRDYPLSGEGKFRGKWRPSIHMPRWASRITLEIINIRVERLHQISMTDCVAEGIPLYRDGVLQQVFQQYEQLWDSINAKRDYSWESNPWVWVIEFKNISPASAGE